MGMNSQYHDNRPELAEAGQKSNIRKTVLQKWELSSVIHQERIINKNGSTVKADFRLNI
jgi:hypothetical protein